jgi:hypothetical protein
MGLAVFSMDQGVMVKDFGHHTHRFQICSMVLVRGGREIWTVDVKGYFKQWDGEKKERIQNHGQVSGGVCSIVEI